MPLPAALARFNRTATNRVALAVAGRLPGFGIVVHRGRRSGRTYRTPVNVFRRRGGWTIALTYGQGDWVRNVLAADGAVLVTRGRTLLLTEPQVLLDPAHTGFPPPVRAVLRLIGADEQLRVEDEAPT